MLKAGLLGIFPSGFNMSQRTLDLSILALPSLASSLYLLPHGHKIAIIVPGITSSTHILGQMEDGSKRFGPKELLDFNFLLQGIDMSLVIARCILILRLIIGEENAITGLDQS